MSLQDNFQLYPEVPQQILADAIRNSHALVLYSSFETFGCVIIEANACGIPVIVSDIPVFHEIVQEGTNGIFAGKEDDDILSKKMISVIKNEWIFNRESIVEMTLKKFSYEVVGKQFDKWYKEALDKPV